MDKLERKVVLKYIKEEIRKRGYKANMDIAYKRNGELFYVIDFCFVDNNSLIVESQVKKTAHDDLLWDIMHLSEDGKLTDSLRAKGAFVTYAINVEKIIIESSKCNELYLKDTIDRIEENLDIFVNGTDLSQYILENEDCLVGGVLLDGNLLKCLVHCEQGNIVKAKEIAMDQLKNNDTGRLEFKGKGFFEWMIAFGD